MTTDDAPVRIRRSLEESHGMETASYLMDRPPGGWSNLVTVDLLDAKLEALEARLDRRMGDLNAAVDRQLRIQTWVTSTAIVTGLTFGMGMAAAIARFA
jgi:hypothetical protein